MQALILAGGSGTRFWPLSRRRRPKQLLALDGERSLLQRTVDRLEGLVAPEAVWVCTTALLADEVRRQLPEVPAAQVLAEPVGRNTAPAIAWAVSAMPETARDEAVAVLPADHRIADRTAHGRALELAESLAVEDDRVVALGVAPRWPETGYGYLELAEPVPGRRGVRQVVRFTEKPDAATAERFVASGRYLWNAGIFVFRGTTFLELVDEHLPELAAGLERLGREPEALGSIYRELPAVSVDYGIMEQLDGLVAVTLDAGWSDLGSWQALAEELASGQGASVTRGRVVEIDGAGNLLWAEEGGTIATLGVSGLVVVTTGDAVLVMPAERAQDVRSIVERLTAERRDDLL